MCVTPVFRALCFPGDSRCDLTSAHEDMHVIFCLFAWGSFVSIMCSHWRWMEESDENILDHSNKPSLQEGEVSSKEWLRGVCPLPCQMIGRQNLSLLRFLFQTTHPQDNNFEDRLKPRLFPKDGLFCFRQAVFLYQGFDSLYVPV